MRFTAVLLGGFLLACSGGVTDAFEEAKVDSTALELMKAGQEVEIFTMKNGRPPDRLDQVSSEPRDAWDHTLVYEVPGSNGDSFDIVSLGRDGKPGGSGLDADLRYSEL